MDSWPTEKIVHVIVLGLCELTATVVLCVSLSAGTFISMRVIGKHLTAYTRKLNVQLTSLLVLQVKANYAWKETDHRNRPHSRKIRRHASAAAFGPS